MSSCPQPRRYLIDSYGVTQDAQRATSHNCFLGNISHPPLISHTCPSLHPSHTVPCAHRAHHPAQLPVRHVPHSHPPRAGRASAEPNCPAGWLPAVGTLYDSWPAPGTTECIDYSGCEWAGQFNNIDPGDGKPCNRGAKWLSGGLQPPNFACRFPQSLVKKWNVAATYKLDNALLGRKLQVPWLQVSLLPCGDDSVTRRAGRQAAASSGLLRGRQMGFA